MAKLEPQLLQMCTSPKDYPKHSANEIVLLGRSNVGKSTFINRFFHRNKLAYISSKPGKTQTLNFYSLNDNLCFVDVPGYGYAKVSKEKREQFGQMIEKYLVTRKNLVMAILLVDFKVGPTSDDLMMYEFLKYANLPVLVVATKKDKIKKTGQDKQRSMIKKKMNLEKSDEFISYSSNEDADIEKIRKFILGE